MTLQQKDKPLCSKNGKRNEIFNPCNYSSKFYKQLPIIFKIAKYFFWLQNISSRPKLQWHWKRPFTVCNIMTINFYFEAENVVPRLGLPKWGTRFSLQYYSDGHGKMLSPVWGYPNGGQDFHFNILAMGMAKCCPPFGAAQMGDKIFTSKF